MKILNVIMICIFISCVYGSFNNTDDSSKTTLDKESSDLNSKESQMQVGSFLLLLTPLVTWILARMGVHFYTKRYQKSRWLKSLIDISGIISIILVLIDAFYGSNLVNTVLNIIADIFKTIFLVSLKIIPWIRWFLMDIVYLGIIELWNFVQNTGFLHLGPLPYLFQISVAILIFMWSLNFIGLISMFPWCRKVSKKSEIAKNPKKYYAMEELFSSNPKFKRPGIPFQFNDKAKQTIGSPLPKRFSHPDEKNQEISDEQLQAGKIRAIKTKTKINIKSCGNSCNDDNDTL